MLLYIIRHGHPDYTTDTLTPTGVLQAEAVGKRLFASKIDRIFTSPMGRARQTAEPACRLLGLNYTVEPWAHEIGKEMIVYFPDGKSKTMGMVQNTYFRENGNIHLDYDHALEAPGFNESDMGTALDYIEENGREFLERLGYKEENGVYRILRANEEKVALFCHAGFARAFISRLLHIPAQIMWAGFNYGFTGVTVLEFKNNKNGVTAPQCLCYSDLSHLYAHGPEMLYNERVPL